MRKLLLATLLLGCSSESSSPATQADTGADTSTDTAPTGPIPVQVDTYNVALAAAGVPKYAERRPVLLAELAKMTGDIACLQEVWREADKVAVRDAMKDNYPHVAWAKTDRATKIDDPTDQKGVTPGAPAAPCAGVEANLDAAIACLSKCSTTGNADGKVTTTDCVKEQCIGEAAAIFAADDKTCYQCFASNLASEVIKDIATVCKAPGYGLGFGGESSPMILSKHPLKDIDHRVLPGCWQQRTVTRATATLPNGADVDVYCNHLSPVNDDPFLPYACPWGGDGTTDTERWSAEQLLQANKLLAWAATRSNRSILLGDLNASPMTTDPTIDSYGVPTLEAIEAAGFVHALADGFTPRCTFCKDNPLTGGAENTWLDHIFIKGIDKSAVQSTAVTFDQKLVGGDAMSDHYGVRVVVTVAP